MEDQNKSPMKFWMVVAVLVLAVLVVFVVRSQLAALATSGKVKCRYLGQGTNNAGVVVSRFDVTGLDGKYFFLRPEAVVFNNQGVKSTNAAGTLGIGASMAYSVTPDRQTLELPFTAPTNAWQLQLCVSRESLPARVMGTLATGKLVSRAYGWPYEHRVLSSEVPPQSP